MVFFKSFGRDPLIVKLPFQAPLNKIKYLRSAKKRIQTLKVKEGDLQRFLELVPKFTGSNNTRTPSNASSSPDRNFFKKNQLVLLKHSRKKAVLKN
jgi:hypothetical protein